MEGPWRNYLQEFMLAHRAARKGSTVRELAAEIGISPGTLNTISKGTRSVMSSILQRIADHFQWGPLEAGCAVWYADTVEPSHKKRPRRKKDEEGT